MGNAGKGGHIEGTGRPGYRKDRDQMDNRTERGHIKRLAIIKEALDFAPDVKRLLISVYNDGTPLYQEQTEQLLTQWARGLYTRGEVEDKIRDLLDGALRDHLEQVIAEHKDGQE